MSADVITLTLRGVFSTLSSVRNAVTVTSASADTFVVSCAAANKGRPANASNNNLFLLIFRGLIILRCLILLSEVEG